MDNFLKQSWAGLRILLALTVVCGVLYPMAVWGVLQGLVGLHRSGRFNMARREFTELCLRSAERIYGAGI